MTTNQEFVIHNTEKTPNWTEIWPQGSGLRAQGSGLRERVLGKQEQKELTEKDKRKLLDTEPITTSLEVQRSPPTY